jgi:hypothetical protein
LRQVWARCLAPALLTREEQALLTREEQVRLARVRLAQA